ncbi:MAG: allantoin permease, partial [Ornithinibacter sp.]|nr:allantoin permease [Ornithinibacter sp.]
EGEGAPYWEGNWPYSNIGVLLALALGFLVTLVARRGTVRRQEEQVPTRDARSTDRQPAR